MNEQTYSSQTKTQRSEKLLKNVDRLQNDKLERTSKIV